jgi:hypothetical protein
MGARAGHDLHAVGERDVERAARRLKTGTSLAQRRARALGRGQPELVAYVVAATRSLSDAAQSAAWRGFELVCEAMAALRMPRVELRRLVEAHTSNDVMTERLDEAHPRIADRWLHHGGWLRQRVLLDRLAGDVTAEVQSGERGAVFFALKTVVDVLDEGRRRDA